MKTAIWQSFLTYIIGKISYIYYVPRNEEDMAIIITICVMGLFILYNINKKRTD